jgi:hypothetical protein
MTYLPHGKPLIHHLVAIATSIATAFVVSAVIMQDVEAATAYDCVSIKSDSERERNQIQGIAF